MKRGEIWWADLGRPVGSSPGLRRPVLVLQRDEVNRSSLATVTVVTITGNRSVAGARGNVLLPGGSCGLADDSVVNVAQVVTVDRSQLDQRVGRVPASLIDLVSEGVAWFLALGE